VSEYGFCELEDAPVINDLPVATEIRTFPDASHLDDLLPPDGFPPPVMVVYGRTWQVFVEPPHLADEVADVLNGTVLDGRPDGPLPTGTPTVILD
ncbi:MAG: hypothetical protein KY391_04950, partial [Actinobacteria bacterium]|nr:hypothetical protein [Actinomycetota bacterium]